MNAQPTVLSSEKLYEQITFTNAQYCFTKELDFIQTQLKQIEWHDVATCLYLLNWKICDKCPLKDCDSKCPRSQKEFIIEISLGLSPSKQVYYFVASSDGSDYFTIQVLRSTLSNNWIVALSKKIFFKGENAS